MDLGSILKADAVKAIGSCTSKKRLFHDLGELSENSYGFDASDVVDALIEREGLGPTGVGHGIALPHARMSGIKCVSGVFIKLERPIDFDSVDRQPVDLVFCLLAPESAGVEHLKALAKVSRALRDGARCGKLRSNKNVSTLYTIITEDVSKLVA